MKPQDRIAHLASEFKRLVMRVQTEQEALLLLEKIIADAYAQGAADERMRHVATDCFGG